MPSQDPYGREAKIDGEPVLVLREPKSIREPDHVCAVKHGDVATEADWRAIIQCTCGKRYKCRESLLMEYVWVRRLLPWPPKQDWPRKDN